jgi:anaerobic selenocysteine-containing dehydrogenase
MLSNLMMMRGQIGKRGAGLCPVRGHSNVQGDRTMGIEESRRRLPRPHGTGFGFAAAPSRP